MANDVSVREDPETNSRPWETVPFPAAGRTVPDRNGNERPLTPYELSRVEANAADAADRRAAAAAQQGGSTIDAAMRARPRPVVAPDENVVYAFHISPSFNEERVFSLTTGEHDEVRGYLKDSTDYLSSTRTALEKIDTAYRALMLDKSLTPDARSLKLEAATSKAFEATYVKHSKALEAITTKINHTEGLLSKPLEQAAATPRSTELRAVLRNMKPAEVSKLIREAISAPTATAQQEELLMCCLGAHHLMIGIPEQELATHVRLYNEKLQPQIHRRLEVLKKSLAIVSSTGELMRPQFEGSMRSKFSRATAIRGISEKAQAALDAIGKE